MLVALLVVFTATRLATGALADHPGRYEHGGSIVGDVTLYQYWGEQIVEHNRVPYRDVAIEYPPGSLPFIAVPAFASGSLYRTLFVVTMVLVDAAGLVGLVLLARRRGSMLGPWLWVVLVPLLGPVAYLRLDLVPAVATIWMLERVAATRWRQAGVWLGIGVAAKLYPLVLLPPLLAFRRWRRPLAAGAGIALLVALLPFAAWASALERSVVRYHLEREIEIESLWGGGLLVGAKAGHGIRLVFGSESLNVVSPASSELKLISVAAVVAALAVMTWAASRLAVAGLEARLPDLLFATLASVLAVATVLSPQYVLWLVALGAAAVCSTSCIVRLPVLLLAPVAALTQTLYPFLFLRLARVDDVALAVLVARDLLLVVLAVLAALAVTRAARTGARRHERAAL
jgi:hypothetical protein